MLKYLGLFCFLFSFQVQAQKKQLTQKEKNVQSCESAFKSAKNSPSTGEVVSAIDICKEAQVKECQLYTGDSNTGDSRYIAGVCGLDSAVAANKSANKNVVVESCAKARKKAMQSPSTGDLRDAIDLCEKETEKICEKKNDGTGDGKLVAANCSLDAAHGSFVMAHGLNKGSQKNESSNQEHDVSK